VNDVTFAHNSAYGDSIFRSWVNLIRQRAPALYTFILKRLRTAQVSAVAVVIFANDCVPGAKSAILDFLKFQCSRNKNVQNANVVTIVVINIFTMLRPKRDWTKYRTSLCYCTLCIYKALDVYSVTIAIVTLNDTVLNTTYIVGLFRETSSAKLGKTEFTLGKIRLQRVAEVKHCTVRCVAPPQISYCDTDYCDVSSPTYRPNDKYNYRSSAVAEIGDRLATIDMGRKLGADLPFSLGVAGSPSNTMWPSPMPTSVPSDILIHSVV